jgi:FKBP-type peptidyl-prolyl cis-trans isomerase 2
MPRPPPHQLSISSSTAPAPMRAVEGDIVTLHWRCINENGEVLESSRASDDPTSFEVGAGDIVGNRLFEAFDEAVRGMALNETAVIKVRVAINEKIN